MIRAAISSSVGLSSSESRKASAARHRQAGEVVDVAPADRDGEHLRLEPRAPAGGAGPERHVLLDPLALARAVGLAVAALERGDDALEGDHVGAPATHAIAIGDIDASRRRCRRGSSPARARLARARACPVDLVTVGDRLNDRLVEARVADRPGNERAVVDASGSGRERAVPGRSPAAHRARCSADRRPGGS